jgi:hypothetical protein
MKNTLAKRAYFKRSDLKQPNNSSSGFALAAGNACRRSSLT